MLLGAISTLSTGYTYAWAQPPSVSGIIPTEYVQPTHDDRSSASLLGSVKDHKTGEPLAGVHLIIVELQRGTTSNHDGLYRLGGIPNGMYTFEARMIGFEPFRTRIQIDSTRTAPVLHIALQEEAVLLSEVVVTPGRFSVHSMEAHGYQTFSEDDLENVPQFGEDIYRAVTRLPGLTANDFSSRFMIRGGEHDEVLVTLDGLELYDPFHMKDIGGGGLSIVDASIIGGVDLLTGAFPASYGNRLSGVFDLTSTTPSPTQNQSSLGISFINSRITSEGRFNNDKTSWTFVGRRGYLDLLLGLIDESFSLVPQYYDAFGKVNHTINTKHSLSVQWLLSGDRVSYLDITDPDDRARSRYGNGYLWTNWKSIWSPRLYSETLLSQGRIWQNRDGIEIREDNLIRFKTDDQRTFHVTNVKQDWTYDATSTYMVSWGVDFKRYAASYDYANTRLIQEIPKTASTNEIVTRHEQFAWDSDPTGALVGVYSRHRVRLGAKLTTELGGRFGLATWSNDRFFEPRVNLMYQVGARTLLRSGWGHFHQVHGINELDVQDGETAFQHAERAEHIVIGLAHQFANQVELRADMYHKLITNVRPRYVSLGGDVTRFFPEIDPDRLRIAPDRERSRGIELLLRKEEGQRFNWWASYTLSFFDERRDGSFMPKSYDQRHTIHLDGGYKPTTNLRINLSWQYHSGWRYSDSEVVSFALKENDVIFETVYGPYNAEQFAPYHRMDLRFSYDFHFKRHGLSTYLEIRNLYNRKNIRTFNHVKTTDDNGSIVFERVPEYWLPILPALGVRLNLNH